MAKINARGMYNVVQAARSRGFNPVGDPKHPDRYVCPVCLSKKHALAAQNPKNNLKLVPKAAATMLLFVKGKRSILACYACGEMIENPRGDQLIRPVDPTPPKRLSKVAKTMACHSHPRPAPKVTVPKPALRDIVFEMDGEEFRF